MEWRANLKNSMGTLTRGNIFLNEPYLRGVEESIFFALLSFKGPEDEMIIRPEDYESLYSYLRPLTNMNDYEMRYGILEFMGTVFEIKCDKCGKFHTTKGHIRRKKENLDKYR